MDPSEVEFLAEKEMVTIIPNFSLDKIYLIGVSELLYLSRRCLTRSNISSIVNVSICQTFTLQCDDEL